MGFRAMCPPALWTCQWSHRLSKVPEFTKLKTHMTVCQLPALTLVAVKQAQLCWAPSVAAVNNTRVFHAWKLWVLFATDRQPLHLCTQSTPENQTSLTMLRKNFWEEVLGCGGTSCSFLPGESAGKDHPAHTKVIFFSKANSNPQLCFSYRK